MDKKMMDDYIKHSNDRFDYLIKKKKINTQKRNYLLNQIIDLIKKDPEQALQNKDQINKLIEKILK